MRGKKKVFFTSLPSITRRGDSHMQGTQFDLVSGVNAREQRAAKQLDARNEGTRVVICVSRALCSIEPSACRLTRLHPQRPRGS